MFFLLCQVLSLLGSLSLAVDAAAVFDLTRSNANLSLPSPIGTSANGASTVYLHTFKGERGGATVTYRVESSPKDGVMSFSLEAHSALGAHSNGAECTLGDEDSLSRNAFTMTVHDSSNELMMATTAELTKHHRVIVHAHPERYVCFGAPIVRVVKSARVRSDGALVLKTERVDYTELFDHLEVSITSSVQTYQGESTKARWGVHRAVARDLRTPDKWIVDPKGWKRNVAPVDSVLIDRAKLGWPKFLSKVANAVVSGATSIKNAFQTTMSDLYSKVTSALGTVSNVAKWSASIARGDESTVSPNLPSVDVSVDAPISVGPVNVVPYVQIGGLFSVNVTIRDVALQNALVMFDGNLTAGLRAELPILKDSLQQRTTLATLNLASITLLVVGIPVLVNVALPLTAGISVTPSVQVLSVGYTWVKPLSMGVTYSNGKLSLLMSKRNVEVDHTIQAATAAMIVPDITPSLAVSLYSVITASLNVQLSLPLTVRVDLKNSECPIAGSLKVAVDISVALSMDLRVQTYSLIGPQQVYSSSKALPSFCSGVDDDDFSFSDQSAGVGDNDGLPTSDQSVPSAPVKPPLPSPFLSLEFECNAASISGPASSVTNDLAVTLQYEENLNLTIALLHMTRRVRLIGHINESISVQTLLLQAAGEVQYNSATTFTRVEPGLLVALGYDLSDSSYSGATDVFPMNLTTLTINVDFWGNASLVAGSDICHVELRSCAVVPDVAGLTVCCPSSQDTLNGGGNACTSSQCYLFGSPSAEAPTPCPTSNATCAVVPAGHTFGGQIQCCPPPSVRDGEVLCVDGNGEAVCALYNSSAGGGMSLCMTMLSMAEPSLFAINGNPSVAAVAPLPALRGLPQPQSSLLQGMMAIEMPKATSYIMFVLGGVVSVAFILAIDGFVSVVLNKKIPHRKYDGFDHVNVCMVAGILACVVVMVTLFLVGWSRNFMVISGVVADSRNRVFSDTWQFHFSEITQIVCLQTSNDCSPYCQNNCTEVTFSGMNTAWPYCASGSCNHLAWESILYFTLTVVCWVGAAVVLVKARAVLPCLLGSSGLWGLSSFFVYLFWRRTLYFCDEIYNQNFAPAVNMVIPYTRVVDGTTQRYWQIVVYFSFASYATYQCWCIVLLLLCWHGTGKVMCFHVPNVVDRALQRVEHVLNQEYLMEQVEIDPPEEVSEANNKGSFSSSMKKFFSEICGK